MQSLVVQKKERMCARDFAMQFHRKHNARSSLLVYYGVPNRTKSPYSFLWCKALWGNNTLVSKPFLGSFCFGCSTLSFCFACLTFSCPVLPLLAEGRGALSDGCLLLRLRVGLGHFESSVTNGRINNNTNNNINNNNNNNNNTLWTLCIKVYPEGSLQIIVLRSYLLWRHKLPCN